MKDDAIAATLRAHVRAKLDRIIDEELTRAGFQRDAITPTPPPAPLSSQDRHNTVRKISYPAHALLHVNRQFLGEAFSPGSAACEVYRAILQHLGGAEMQRAQLQREVATLLPHVRPGTISGTVSTALARGCLLGRVHAIGEAYRA